MSNNKEINGIESFDFKALGARMLKYWYLFLIALTIGGVKSFYEIRYSVPMYSTYGKALLKDEYSSWGQEYFIKGMELVSTRDRIANVIGLISSFNMMREVIDELDFEVFYYDIGDVITTELYKKSPFIVELDTNQSDQYRTAYYYAKLSGNNKISIARSEEFKNSKDYSFNKWVDLNGTRMKFKLTDRYIEKRHKDKLFSFSINDLNSLAKVYQRSIFLETEPMESSILKLKLQGPTIHKEIDFINALMDKYIENGLKESSEIATNTIKFVDDQLKDVAGDLMATEKKLENFKLKNNEDKLQINSDYYIPTSNEIQSKFIETQFEYNFYSEVITKLNDSELDRIFIPNLINVTVQDPLYRSIEDLMSLYNRKKQLETAAKDSNTTYQLLIDQIKTNREILSANIESRLLQTQFKLDQLKEQLLNIDGMLTNLPAAESEYIRIDRIYNLNNEFYNYLLQKRSEAAVAEASNVPNAKIVESASDYTVAYVGQIKTAFIY